MPRNPGSNFVFQASTLERHLQEHFPGAQVEIITPKPPADFPPALHVIHNEKILARMALNHLGKGDDPLVRTRVDIKVASRQAEVIRNIAQALMKAHAEMRG